jgi:Flp pilus assembly pilin Flp
LENTQVLNNFYGVLVRQSAATLVEYALVVDLIAISCVGNATALGGHIKTAFTTMSTKLAAA